MKIFKNIKNSRLYLLVNLNGSFNAIPFNHDGKPICNCNIKEFVPASDSSRVNSRINRGL